MTSFMRFQGDVKLHLMFFNFLYTTMCIVQFYQQWRDMLGRPRIAEEFAKMCPVHPGRLDPTRPVNWGENDLAPPPVTRLISVAWAMLAQWRQKKRIFFSQKNIPIWRFGF